MHGLWVQANGIRVCLSCHERTAPAGTTPPSCASCHPLFPHSENWVQRENHGAWVIENGTESCATQCHGEDFAGGLSEISCQNCHSVFPHRPGWASPSEHGSAAEGVGKEICQACHGDDFQGGSSGVSCYQCHENYPHAAGWGDPLQHGIFILDHGTGSCATECHGSDLGGGLSEVSCTSCHSLYPHGAGWADFEGHARAVLDTLDGDATACQACHGSDFRGGIAGVSCFECHANYPHPSGWQTPAAHGVAAYGTGKQSCATANCHGTDFAGGPSAPSCFSCHADFPHLRPEWMSPQRTNNAGLRPEGFHGDTFIRRMQGGEINPCSECHGINYDRSLGGVQCTVCHAAGITHRVRWSSGRGHGKFYSEHFNSASDDAGCQICHGAPIPFERTYTTTAPLTAASDCYRCHFAYPHAAFHSGRVEADWAPVVDECGRPAGNLGHILYMMSGGSPLFTDSRGTRPANPNDPLNLSAIRHTCAGSEAGSCHFNGYRSYQTAPNALLCTGYCHNPDNPELTPPPDRSCPPPPPAPPCPARETLCVSDELEWDPFCYNPATEPEACPPR
ncbi:MAG: hypothetical protein HY466_01445 [Deltaproteobacteria bacterium]|nr:hypothetical protein [Deltaproteobacteria bacterium]